MASISLKRNKRPSSKRAQIQITRPYQIDESASFETSWKAKSSNAERRFMELPPDKEVEEIVLQACFVHLSSNLPPDDVSIEMNSRGLLTVKEHEEYVSMKRAHTSDSTKSEYLLQCLGRRKAGFLTQFCEILRDIVQASYLADDITEAYKRAALQRGSTTTTCKRASKISLSISDPDLRSGKDIYHTQECTKCKVLEYKTKKLERQIRHLRDEQLLNQTTFLPFKPLAEVTQEQLQKGLAEINKLMSLVPSMQEAITQATGGVSGAQASLKKLNDVVGQDSSIMAKQKKSVWTSPLVVSLRESVVSEASVFGSEGELEHSMENKHSHS